MDLSGLLPLIRTTASYRALREAGNGQETAVLEEAKGALAAALAGEAGAPVLLVTSRASRSVSLLEQVQAWLGPTAKALALPEPDVLPYEQLEPDRNLVRDRLRALYALRTEEPPLVIVAAVHALATRTLSPDVFVAGTISLARGARFNFEGVAGTWVRAGYQRVETVRNPGEFARRGGIIDCFAPNMELPVRMELFGDEIDSMRFFDPETQRSTDLAEAVTLGPAREWLSNDEAPPPGRRGRLPYIFTAADYLPAGAVVLLDEPRELEQSIEELERDAAAERSELIERGELPRDAPVALAGWEDISSRLAGAGRVVRLRRWGEGAPLPDPSEDLMERSQPGFAPVPGYAGRLKQALTDMRRAVRAGERVIVVSHQSRRLAELMEEEAVPVRPVETIAEPPEPGSVSLVHGALPGGWRVRIMGDPHPSPLPEGEGILRVVTDSELFGFVKANRRRPSRRAAFKEHPLAGVTPGDYVVHIEHGIGKFVETVTMEEQPGARKEYLLLSYANGGRLFVPTEQIDRVSRYVGQGGHEPSLSNLGTQEWDRAKSRVKAAAANVAKELLETTAARQAGAGHAFSPDSVWQQEMEASFPYVETPDQLQAVHDVKSDMELLRPMDRLVCGDVGYGKTEVAVRAAFKAVQEGTQVAMLVPTTVLAQQHYQTFSERLSAFPVKVATLSRFQSDKEQRDILEELRTGTLDIVVGTHRLVQKDVEFRNLGLVVVDEEQRFGVLHKEYFKRLRTSVDVLTLSATPIPRTLYMAMVNVRDMSVMETPPEERLPIKTYVMEYDEGTVRQAILREIERGGQIFFVHNRVHTIGEVTYKLRKLVPEATFCIGHGQMPEELLERTMVEFTAGEYDVLVCSTIIESGLDLPNVNTIIINDADKLGLSQLYQLRGRVGRGANRAYAYLLFTRNKALTERAEKRLQAVFEATDLGAGYYIAMKDLEIRGAGNLLGVEQSGQIGAVGFDLYCRILASAVEDAKAVAVGKTPPSQIPLPPPVSLDLRLPAYLPDDYVQEMDARLELYRRMASANALEEVEEMEQELYDRFGPLPAPVEHLLFSVRVKILATLGGAESVGLRGEEIVVQLHEGLRVDASRFAGLKRVRPGTNQVRVDASGPVGRWGPELEAALARLGG